MTETNDDKTIFRRAKNKENPYVMIDRSIFANPSISWKAKGLLGYLLSKPDDWVTRLSDLVKHSTDGRAATQTAIKELEVAGYLTRHQDRDEKGHFTQFVIEIHEIPVPPSERTAPQAGFPQAGSPQAGNQPLLSSDGTSLTDNESTDNSSDAKTASEGNEKPLSSSASVTDSVTEQPQEQESLAEALGELEYVPIDEDGNEPATIPKWRISDNDFQREFLAVCKAKWFKPKQKGKVKKFEQCLRAGEMARDDVFQNCIVALESFTDFPDRIVPIPSSWYEWRADQAREHHWSVDGFIKALFNRDALVQHCQIELRKRSVSAAEQPSDGVIRIGDGKMPLPPDGIIRI